MPLEDLKKRLYRKGETFEERLSTPELELKSKGRRIKWEDEGVKTLKKTQSGIFWGAIIVFMLLVAGGLVLFLSGFPSFLQVREIKVEIIGEGEIRSGGLTVWNVKLTNNGSAPMRDVVVAFNYPQDASPGSSRARVITGLGESRRIFRERRSIGTLGAGGTAQESFDAFVFGKAGSIGEVSAVVEYRPEGASAIFAKDAEFSFLVARSPVSISYEIPAEIRSGQDVEININYVSQSDEALENLFLKAALPGSFEINSVFPPALGAAIPFNLEENELAWQVGTLRPAQSGKITLRGKLAGAELEPKNFSAEIGIYDERVESFLSYDESQEVVVLRPRFLEVSMAMNGELEYISKPGDDITFEVRWRNNLPAAVSNATMEVFLEGDAIDFSSIRVNEGAYRHTTQSVVWNAASYEEFRNIAPGDTGTLKFDFKVLRDLSRDSSSPRPFVRVEAVFRPGGIVAGFEGVDIAGNTEVEIPVSSSMQLVSQVFYFNSPIANTGPLPAEVGKETTYTVVWSLANMANDVENIVAKSSLPPYVTFKGIVVPADMDLIYDKNTGEVIWRVPHLPAGTGFTRAALQVAFQIGFVPSPSQAGFSPVLVEDASAEGKDRYTGVALTSSDRRVTASLPDDPSVGFNQRGVVK